MTWTIQQLAIFAWFTSAAIATKAMAIVVRARAGTGKTTSIVEAIKRFVAAAGRPVAVLACAFNKEIADELQARFPGVRGVEAKTLHALGYWYVNRALGRRKPRDVDGGNRRRRYLAAKVAPTAPDEAIALIGEVNAKGREIEPFASCGAELEALAYQFDLVPDEELVSQGWTVERICDMAHKAMVFGAHDFTSMDYADMIFWPLVNRWVFPRYDLTVVDEAQDMTRSQLELALQATFESGHVAVVGDDRQAIYAFRGADSGSLDRLKAELQAEEMGLTVTYRCGRKIVDLAAKLVPDYVAADGAHEGEIVECSIDRMVAEVQAGDFILSRTNAPLASMCLQLIRDGHRAYIRGREIGQGLISLIRKLRISDVADLPSALDAWKAREMAKVARGADDDKANGQRDLIADKVAVILALADGCATLAEVAARIDSLFVTPKRGERDTRIMLSTVHKAKGLEAGNVFLLDSTFKRAGGEEDNIRYVAITRAKNRLAFVR